MKHRMCDLRAKNVKLATDHFLHFTSQSFSAFFSSFLSLSFLIFGLPDLSFLMATSYKYRMCDHRVESGMLAMDHFLHFTSQSFSTLFPPASLSFNFLILGLLYLSSLTAASLKHLMCDHRAKNGKLATDHSLHFTSQSFSALFPSAFLGFNFLILG